MNLKVMFLNRGGARAPSTPLQWESPNSSVKFAATAGRMFGLAPGESAASPVTLTYTGAAPATVRIVAVGDAGRMPVDVAFYPPAEAATDFEIADGRTADSYGQPLGDGNGDGHASPGETIGILLPEGGVLKAAEVVTNDPCLDLSARVAGYSLPTLRDSCEPGHVVRALAHAGSRWAAIEFPVWYRR
jgi:hypothetical protein